jgi:nicotinamide phosphoribosyltransferase
MFLVDSRLHDFGFRGCASVEQSVLGGTAHLLSFGGSDTCSACYHAQFHLNGGRPVGSSIPATEHSVMTAWPSEKDAILNTIEQYGDGLFACVMDSYDYDNALNVVLPEIAEAKAAKSGTMVLRPDSGDPTEQVLKALKAGEKTFGASKNSKGYKVLNNVAVIQGDGISYKTVKEILDAVLAEGYSASNVAFGMGGGLLQKCNRDTMSFATKLSHIVYADGTGSDVMKTPKKSIAKVSLPGRLFVGRDPSTGAPLVLPKGDPSCQGMQSVMRVVYDKRPVAGAFEDFDVVKARVASEWASVKPNGTAVSPQLQEKIHSILHERGWKV